MKTILTRFTLSYQGTLALFDMHSSPGVHVVVHRSHVGNLTEDKLWGFLGEVFQNHPEFELRRPR